MEGAEQSGAERRVTTCMSCAAYAAEARWIWCTAASYKCTMRASSSPARRSCATRAHTRAVGANAAVTAAAGGTAEASQCAVLSAQRVPVRLRR
jgi:hypothetical protein